MELLTYLHTEPVSWILGADTLISVVMVKKGNHRSCTQHTATILYSNIDKVIVATLGLFSPVAVGI